MNARLTLMQQDGPKILNGSDLLTDFENALSKQRSKCMSGFALTESRESHYQSHIQHRLNELEGYYHLE